MEAGGRNINNLYMSETKKKEESKMISKMREKCKNKKGFTLVELIVVLVILAILIALLVPSLTGYIDKANEKKVLAEAKLALNAAQVTVTEEYSTATEKSDGSYGENTFTVIANGTATTGDKADELIKLSEIKNVKLIKTYVYTATTAGKVTSLTFGNEKYTATYTDGTWSTAKVTTK